MKVKRSNQGLTILEVVLAFFVLSILVTSIFSVRKNHLQQKKIYNCSLNQWRWLKAFEEIEYQFRKWEYVGGNCLKAGINPILDKTENRFLHWIIDSASPLLRAKRFPEILEVPEVNSFSSGQEVFICDRQHYEKAIIQRTHQTGSKLSVLDITGTEGSKLSNTFGIGSMVIAVKKLSYEIEPSEIPGEQVLFYRIGEDRKRRLSGNFESFSIKPFYDDLDRKVEIDLLAQNHECSIGRRLIVKGSEFHPEQGQWLLGDQQLFLKAWE